MTKPLTTINLSAHNLLRKPFRTACIVLVVAVMVFALFGGAILSASLENGLRSLKARLGADLAVVPLDHESDYEGIILTGEPERFYLDQSVAGKIAKVEGVEKVTSQFYISTLAAACCTVPVQVIGFDPKTDFVVQPWIKKVYDKEINAGELVVGSDIVVKDSKTLKFFNRTYKVVAQLDKTSTGMDQSVYANMDTIKTLVADAEKVGMKLSVNVNGGDIDHSISAVLVKISDGYDAETVTTNIHQTLDGVSVVKSKSIFSSTAHSINMILKAFDIVIAVLWVLATMVLIVIFSVTIHARKREFALLRIVGATRKKLVVIVLGEALLAGGVGGVSGIVLASLVVFPFSTYIKNQMNLPYLLPHFGLILGIAALSLLASFLIGPLTAAYGAARISRAEVYATMREGE